MTEAPVRSEYGWHVMRLADERQLTFPAYDDVKAKIYENLQRQAVDEIIAGLRAKAEIE
jgi:peptidyl-prolyl cis-trans isomerase C